MEKMDFNLWFGLSYASWLTIPRIVLESMPEEWQCKMVELINEMNDAFEWSPSDVQFFVNAKKHNKFIRMPYLLNDYRRGSIEHLRRKNKASEMQNTGNQQPQETPLPPIYGGDF